MKPRVFVSSTYYDLKYVRENLELFIRQYGFDPVLFESGMVTFEHGKQLDLSCYQEVNLCHIMILIIGGRYGSSATKESENQDEERYTSITKKEFETAQIKGIPIFVFVDKNVYSEYQTYKRNERLFLNTINKDLDFKFAYVDSVNIFNFIDSVSLIAIKTFEKVDDIIEYLRNQLAGMFFLYLYQLQKEKSNTEIINSINELNGAVSRMDTIVEALGKKLIKDDYSKIEEKQFEITARLFANRIYPTIEHATSSLSRENILTNAQEIAQEFYEQFLNTDNKRQKDILERYLDYIVNSNHSLNHNANPISIDYRAQNSFIDTYTTFKNDIKPLIKSPKQIEIIINKIAEEIIENTPPF